MTRWIVVDKKVDQVAVVGVAVVGGVRCRRLEGRTVESFPFIVGVEYVCRILLKLPTEVDG